MDSSFLHSAQFSSPLASSLSLPSLNSCQGNVPVPVPTPVPVPEHVTVIIYCLFLNKNKIIEIKNN